MAFRRIIFRSWTSYWACRRTLAGSASTWASWSPRITGGARYTAPALLYSSVSALLKNLMASMLEDQARHAADLAWNKVKLAANYGIMEATGSLEVELSEVTQRKLNFWLAIYVLRDAARIDCADRQHNVSNTTSLLVLMYLFII